MQFIDEQNDLALSIFNFTQNGLQSKDARLQILRTMLTAMPRPKPEPSIHAPRLLRTKIDPDKIGQLIGPGGKNIRSIQESAISPGGN